MTPRTDSDQASGHLKILNSSSMSAALCVPIVLEFCKLLKRAAGVDDPLYGSCRSSLGTMVEYTDIRENKWSIGLGDIFPFVSELAAKLSHDLVVSAESTSFPGPSPSIGDVDDFTAFMVAVRNEIKRDLGFSCPVRLPLSEELPLCYADEITILHGIFVNLLSKLDRCLVKIEEHAKENGGETLSVGCQYLGLLKELNSISKLYYGSEEVFWETMKRRTSALCYIIVRCANRSDDDHKWILECKK
ncbi:hypothetical protein DH2020_017076 [Rehmannia glutinosa]|uniref:Uncharacterized protein n=1 Tax=Rehmannia glutinosa TaxID=99300 RepID=A0ABR0WSF4_REHGL